jgi:hypothetical protein
MSSRPTFVRVSVAKCGFFIVCLFSCTLIPLRHSPAFGENSGSTEKSHCSFRLGSLRQYKLPKYSESEVRSTPLIESSMVAVDKD